MAPPPRNATARTKTAKTHSDSLLTIFRELKALLKPYSPPLVQRGVNSSKPQYHLWSVKNIEIAGRKRKEVYFAGIIIQKGYVGFYYMPAYADGAIKKALRPELLRLLKGKSCFYIRELNPSLKNQIQQALRLGFRHYQSRGWI